MHEEHAGCSDCHHHGSSDQRHWRHVVIRILVALFIFWAGVQFGELKAVIHQYASYGYGYSMMNWGGQSDRIFFQGPSMMYKGVYGTASAPAGATVTVPAAE